MAKPYLNVVRLVPEPVETDSSHALCPEVLVLRRDFLAALSGISSYLEASMPESDIWEQFKTNNALQCFWNVIERMCSNPAVLSFLQRGLMEGRPASSREHHSIIHQAEGGHLLLPDQDLLGFLFCCTPNDTWWQCWPPGPVLSKRDSTVPRKDIDPARKQSWIYIQALPLTGCMAAGKLFNLFMPQFSHPQDKVSYTQFPEWYEHN